MMEQGNRLQFQYQVVRFQEVSIVFLLEEWLLKPMQVHMQLRQASYLPIQQTITV